MSNGSLLDKAIRYDAGVHLYDKAEDAPDKGAALARRGSLQTEYGFAAAGLRDLQAAIRAYGGADRAPPFVLALLGEAKRVYTRDVLLASPDHVPLTYDTLRQSRAHFDVAVHRIEGAAARAWVHAHRGAVDTLVYWLAITKIIPPNSPWGPAGDELAIFARADQDFYIAEELHESVTKKKYEWSVRFHAFLHALRGDGERDFKAARSLLDSIYDGDHPNGLTRSYLDRAYTMLYSYDQTVEAAARSVHFGMQAVSNDMEDCIASYFSAASLWQLRKDANGDLARTYDFYLESAIEGAARRSRNAISEAYATLFGLALLKMTRGDAAEQTQGETEAQGILEKFAAGDPFPNLETWAMLRRDPVWRWHEANQTAVYAKMKPYVDRCWETLRSAMDRYVPATPS